MDPREIEMLVQRLVANPHDQEALAYAHRAGAQDPRSYAMLLERVGMQTHDPAYGAHWLSEAANVWQQALGDLSNTVRTLMPRWTGIRRTAPRSGSRRCSARRAT